MSRPLRLKEKEQEKTTVSKKRAKPAVKKKAAKSNGKTGVSVGGKRTATTIEDRPERPSKVEKTGSTANISRMANSKELDNVPDKAAPRDIIDISSDDDAERSIRTPQMLARTRAAHSKAESAVPMKQDEGKEPKILRQSDKRLAPSISKDEAQRLQTEVEAAQNAPRSLQAAELYKNRASTQLEQGKMTMKHEETVAELRKELEAEQKLAQDLMQQHEELRTQLQRHQEESMKYSLLEIEHQELKSRYEEEERSHRDVLQEILKCNETSKEEITSLQAENGRLANELQTLKASAPSVALKFVPPPSPALSSSFSFPSEEERKEDNVRKMYSELKRQHGIVAAVNKDLLGCTRNMDLSSFGDFGRCVKRLKVAMETEDKSGGQGGWETGKADDDEGWGSQGSRS